MNKERILNDIEEDELTRQLKTVNMMEDSILNKDRLIYINNIQIRRYDTHIKMLIISIIFIIILFFIISVFEYNRRTLIIIVILLIIYILILMYNYNIYHLNDILNPYNLKKTKYEVSKEIVNKLDKGQENIINYMYGSKENWYKNNCSNRCKREEEIEPEIEVRKVITVEEEENVNGGYFYQDRSTPNQLMIPLPSEKTSGKYRDRIYHIESDNINRENIDKKLYNTWTSSL